MRLEGKTALVTGGARRIGAALCEALAAEGARVAIHYHRSRADAEGVRGRCPGSVALCADLATPGGRARLLEQAQAAVGGIDILVQNAAVYEAAALAEIDEAMWERTLSVNLTAPFFLARDLGLAMRAGAGGVIIHLTDWAVGRPYPNRLPYFAAKAGLAEMTRGLARALAPEVRVNAVAPGAMLPPEGASAESVAAMAKAAPLGHLGGLQPVVSAVMFLVCNDFITGETIVVDGGRSLR